MQGNYVIQQRQGKNGFQQGFNKTNQFPPKKGNCNYCGKLGHFARECRSRLRDEAQKQLAQIKTVESGVEYLNKVKAIETWARAEKKDGILQNAIAEQKVRTQKILGGLLKQDIQHQGGRKKTVDNNDRLSLKDVGITKDQSSTFQKIASMPEELFEKEIAQAIMPA